MRKLIVIAGAVLLLALATGTAMAETIQNRFGITGRLGFLIPGDSDFDNLKLETDAGFIGGGGFIYGIDRNYAVELDFTHSWYGSNLVSGDNAGDFSITNISFGGQYRFTVTDPKVVPYAGAGLDVLLGEFKSPTGTKPDIDTMVGIHVSGGVDYFIQSNIALTAEGKLILAPEADIKESGKRGNLDPSGFVGTFGVRYFF